MLVVLLTVPVSKSTTQSVPLFELKVTSAVVASVHVGAVPVIRPSAEALVISSVSVGSFSLVAMTVAHFLAKADTVASADAFSALVRWLKNAGIAIPESMPIITMTTRSSINVKPACRPRVLDWLRR